MSYLTDIMKKRKNIQFFKEEAPDKKVIDDILREAHDLIPHKNNFWHYKIRVYGPEHKEEKRRLAVSSLGGTKKDEYRACLLYTSPSPRDRTRSRMPSSA